MTAPEVGGQIDMSVIMPVYNAMPYLPKAVHDVLYQTNVRIEFIAVDDGSDDGSYEFLQQVARLLGAAGEPNEEPRPKKRKRAQTNPAAAMADRPQSAACVDAAPPESMVSMTAEEVAGLAVEGHRMRVLSVGGCGQGAAMTVGLENASVDTIGQMESDDERPEDAFSLLLSAYKDAKQAGVDAVCSQVGLCGWESAGMQKYIDWQNGLLTANQMSESRFIEIPALHQTCLYSASQVKQIGGYRDIPEWPVDIDFWMRWFESSKSCLKLPKQLYVWRQHQNQGTRTNGRCSLANLRKCKVHYLMKSVLQPYSTVLMWSTGHTLDGWCTDLEAADSDKKVVRVIWNSKDPVPSHSIVDEQGNRVSRLFGFGEPKARRRVIAMLKPKFDPEHDWFVA